MASPVSIMSMFTCASKGYKGWKVSAPLVLGELSPEELDVLMIADNDDKIQ